MPRRLRFIGSYIAKVEAKPKSAFGELVIPGSYSGSTRGSGPRNLGSNPSPGAIERRKMDGQRQILMVIAQNDFRDEEYEIPKTIFEEAGFLVKTASERRGEAMGKLGTKVQVDLPLMEIDIDDFEALIFVGGPGAADYFHDGEVLNLVRDFSKKGKVTAAICIAPSILANAGILEGQRATAFPSEQENLTSRGAEYSGAPVESSGNIITANGPQAAKEFAQAIIKALSSRG